ncbi:hypothetical protein [uncultured Methanobrevibacter sp.]|uniref:hypothetical protein n=1 Tax=uncultured Methanobrevibacter sp. TaxID=253161 RepID=UPI0025FCE210|nr:hypothetical protein [uncultured Methanobrevibacter sp.]
MKNSSKIVLGFMLVMIVCCVSAVSATDINSTDDTLITDAIAVDDVSEIVEEVEIDDASDDVVEEQCSCTGANSVTVNSTNYGNYFNTNGWTTTNNNLTFVGNFNAQNFGNFKIDKQIVIDASQATFTNIGFDLKTSHITLCGGTFIANEPSNINSVIYSEASYSTIKCVKINVTAPNGADFYAIDLINAERATLLNNVINYIDNYANTANYNYVVKVKGGSYIKMVGNNITAFLPLKDVDYSHWTPEPTIDYDLVAGVAVESSSNFNFTGNKLDITANSSSGYYPTLDAFIIVKSDNSKIIGNKIYEQDTVSGKEDTNYLYAIDVYRCNNILIDNNRIELNSKGGNLTVNGTGAAYGVQLTGPHTGVVISNNNITTANNGPNLGIYSQNTEGETNLTIICNKINVTGRAGNNPWALVSGMELQDDYAYVCGNDITVNNLAGNNTSLCAYGISYSQWTDFDHVYYVCNNTVRLYNGTYAVFMTDTTVRSNIINNTLNTTYYSGDNAVFIDRSANYVGGNI